MIELATLAVLAAEIEARVTQDKEVLQQMQADVRPLKAATRRIQPRAATAISLVGTDGGNNQLRFDPFRLQLVRVVDSSNNEYCLEVITPRTPITELSRRHIDGSGKPLTAMGRMMAYLGAKDLSELSPVFNPNTEERSVSWMAVYREMTEWAVLFELIHNRDFGTDTLVVCDGLLRSKMFKGTLFGKYREGLEDGIRRQFERNRRRIYICGIAKHNAILQTYRIALAVEGVMRTAYPCYVEVPENIQEKVYVWDEYFSRADKFVAGKMFLVKFGSGMHDPVWAVDLFLKQRGEAQTVFGYLLEDAKDGFPIPFYPQCLQRAHENAALVDFDLEILEDQIHQALRSALGEKKWIIDELALQEVDPAARRY